MSGIFGSAGQSCVAGFPACLSSDRSTRRSLPIWSSVRSRIRVGLPDDPATQMGPLISRGHRDKVAGYVDLARNEGGRVLLGGHAPKDQIFAKGYFYLPTIVDSLSFQARACQGRNLRPGPGGAAPLRMKLICSRRRTARPLACPLAYGLPTTSRPGVSRASWRLARFWINTYKQSHIATPFGGFKSSGIGREKGLQGLRLYSQTKSIYWGNASEADGTLKPWALH